MVDYHSGEIITRSSRMLMLIAYAAFGMWILEFTTSLYFDWEIVTGKRKFRLTFIPYLLARYCMLAAKITAVFLFNMWLENPNCQAWVHANYSLYVISYSFSFMLVLLRVIALANYSWKVTVPLGAWYLLAVSLACYADSQIQGFFIAEAQACAILNSVVTRYYIYVVATFDITCLGVLFFILMQQKGDTLWKLLFTQGIQYMLIACLAYIPSMVIISLNLNDAVNVCPDTLCVVVICIAVQRMYRQLVEYGSELGCDNSLTSNVSTTYNWGAGTQSGTRTRAVSGDIRSVGFAGTGTRDQPKMSPVGNAPGDIGEYPLSPRRKSRDFSSTRTREFDGAV